MHAFSRGVLVVQNAAFSGRTTLQPRVPAPRSCWTCRCRQASPTRRVPKRSAWCQAAEVNFDALDVDLPDMPDIDADLTHYQELAGATFQEGVAVTFGNEKQAAQALETGVVLIDRSHWGRLRVAGEDRLTFLHGQSTNDFLALRPGHGCNTVFVTAQARTIELATCYAQGSGVLVVVSPGMAPAIMQRLDKYIFFGDKVEVLDVSSRTAMFSLAGPEAGAILAELRAQDVLGQPPHHHRLLSFQGSPVIAAAGSGLATPGYTLITDEAAAADLWRSLALKGAVPMGERGWEQARVMQGRPVPGAELTEERNPLEAGLYSAVSISKGCYIGQETISKVHNQKAVRQQLWGLRFEGPAAAVVPGCSVIAAGSNIGVVTSVTTMPGGDTFALAFLRCKSKGAPVQLLGIAVEVACCSATLVETPFASRSFPEEEAEAAAAQANDAGWQERAEAARQQKDEGKAAAEAAKALRLQQMQERLAAWQAEQASG